MNTKFSNIQDEITFQMGLNLRLYQEIEQMMKRLISTSSQTIQTTSLVDEETQAVKQPTIDLWSNRANLEKATLGNLLPQLEQTEKEPHYKEHDDINAIQISLSYDIPLIVFFNMPEFEQDFKQIVSDRNQFIHHFQSIGNQDNEIFSQLKESYERAEKFKNKHLIPCSQELERHIHQALDLQISMLKNHYRLTAYHYFEEIYYQHKRVDDWAVWATLMHEIQKNNPSILNGLRNESSFISKNTAWTKIIQDIYPNWHFMEEQTTKGGKRLLVKVDNSLVKLKDNTLIKIEKD